MSEIPPTPAPFPYPTPPSPPPTPPTDTPLIPAWFYSLNVLLLIAGIIVALVVVYLTYKLLTKRVENSARGNLLEEYAFLYLAKELEESGWKLYRGEKIGGREYDCLGWKGELKNKRSSDLAIEMYFPIPKNEQSYEFEYIQKQTDKMVRRLEKINAKQKYILLGVPRDRTITVVERPRPDIRVVYQEYRFTKTEPKKRKALSHE